MEHSSKFLKVKQWFELSMWTEKRVRDSVEKGWITETEFQEITGKSYSANAAVT